MNEQTTKRHAVGRLLDRVVSGHSMEMTSSGYEVCSRCGIVSMRNNNHVLSACEDLSSEEKAERYWTTR